MTNYNYYNNNIALFSFKLVITVYNRQAAAVIHQKHVCVSMTYSGHVKFACYLYPFPDSESKKQKNVCYGYNFRHHSEVFLEVTTF